VLILRYVLFVKPTHFNFNQSIFNNFQEPMFSRTSIDCCIARSNVKVSVPQKS
jgi:hypothetical protein